MRLIEGLKNLRPFEAFKICFGLYLANLWLSSFVFIDKLFRLNDISLHKSEYWKFVIDNNLTYVLISSFVLASLGLMFNKTTRVSAIWLLSNWIIFFHLMPFIYSPPNGGYIGWSLLWFIFYPKNYITPSQRQCWWIILGAGFCISGYSKWFSPLWVQGEALWYIGLKYPFTELQKIPLMVNLMTYSTLILETFAVFFIWHRWGRFAVWVAFCGMHFFITLSMSVAEVGLFFLIFNLALVEDNGPPPQESVDSEELNNQDI